MEEYEILIAPDMILKSTEEEPFVFVLDYPVRDDQDFIYIDRETCKRFYAEFLELINLWSSGIDLNWLTRASFLQVVRVFAKRPREN
jgi:hypothetical protein